MDNQTNRPAEEQLQAWREKFGKVFVMESEEEVNGETLCIVARKPSRASFERYQDEVIKKGAKAMLQFVKENVLFPSKESMAAILDDKPGIASAIATNLQDVMGVSVTFTMTES